MNDPILKFKFLAKSEMTIVKLQARRAINQISMSAIALLFILLGIGMLNFAGYLSFATRSSPAFAALSVAGIDIVIGSVVLYLATRVNRDSSEEKIATEIRDLVYAELNSDTETIKKEFTKLSYDVSRIRNGLNALTSGKSGSFIGIVSLLELLNKITDKKSKVAKEKLKESQT